MNKRLVWLIELIIWVIIITFVSFSIIYVKSLQEQKYHSYYIFFQDIDGLMQGSPVRFMGMQIGYVNSIKVFPGNVFVSFLVTEPNVKIPDSSSATIEFYGLGGSKSLEIKPPALNPQSKDFIIVEEPYRIQKFYNVQNQIAQTLINMGNSFSLVVKENEIYKTQSSIKIGSKVSEANVASSKVIEFIENIKIKHIKKTENESNIELQEGESELE